MRLGGTHFFVSLLAGTLLAGCAGWMSSTVPPVKETAAKLTPTHTPAINERAVVDGNILAENRPLRVQPAVANFLMGTLAERGANLEEAAVFYTLASQADPQNFSVKERAFLFNMAVGNMEEARLQAEDLQYVKDASPLALLLLGLYEIPEGDLQQAHTLVEELEEISPQVLQFRLINSYLEIAMGKSAEEVVQELIQHESNALLDGHRYYHISRIYDSIGRLEEAQQYALLAFEKDPGSIFGVLHLGQLLEQEGQTDVAKEIYDAFQRSNPNSVLLQPTFARLEKNLPPQKNLYALEDNVAEVMFGFTTLMTFQGMDLAGRQLLHMTMMVNPDFRLGQFYTGILEEKSGRLSVAQRIYEEIPENDFTWLSSQIRLVDILEAMERQQDAERKLQELLEKYQSLSVLHQTAAEMHYNRQDYKKAINHYDVVLGDLEKLPREHQAAYYFARGSSHERLKNFDKAVVDLEKSLELNPNNPMVLNYLGYMWVDLDQRIDEAFSHIMKALSLRPNDGAIVDSLGWAYYKKGNYTKAAQYLERAVELLPEDATVNTHLGDVYEKLGRLTEARIQWKRALEIGADDSAQEAHLLEKLATQKTARTLSQ